MCFSFFYDSKHGVRPDSVLTPECEEADWAHMSGGRQSSTDVFPFKWNEVFDAWPVKKILTSIKGTFQSATPSGISCSHISLFN